MDTTRPNRRRRTKLAAKMIQGPPDSDLGHIIEPLRPFAMHVAALTADPRNPRLHEDRNLKALADSMRRFGQDQPLIYRREDGVIIKGNGRYLAARAKLGWEWIAAIAVDDPIVEAAARGLADNQASRLSDVDPMMLGMILETIKGDDDELVGLIGYTEREADALISSMAADRAGGEDDLPKRWAPPTDAVGLAAELIVQGVAIDRLITELGERYDLEKLKGRRAEILLEAVISTIADRSAHLRRHASDLQAERLKQLFASALAAKDLRAALQAHRELTALANASPAAIRDDRGANPDRLLV